MLKRSHRYAVPLVLASFINSLAICQVEAQKLEEADARLMLIVEDLNRQRLTPQPADDRENRADKTTAGRRPGLECTPERTRAKPRRAAPVDGSTPGCAGNQQTFAAGEACEATLK